MRIGDLTKRGDRSLINMGSWTRTLAFRRKLDQSIRAIEEWRGRCSRPIVSVSGGKDSTLLLLLCRQVDPDIIALRADPPNPLPDRQAHVDELKRAMGGSWSTVDYPWDVDAVLARDERYPARLKIRALQTEAASLGADGVAIGIRAAESRERRISCYQRGLVYRVASGRLRCTPLAWWTAEEVIGALVSQDAAPLNPVYRRTHLMPRGRVESLRDGTWWPHIDPADHRPWLAYHYPELIEQYDRAVFVHRQRLEDWNG